MTGNGARRPTRDGLDIAQLLVLDLQRRCERNDHSGLPLVKPEIALQLATASALVDIARSLRSLEGYLCNRAPAAES